MTQDQLKRLYQLIDDASHVSTPLSRKALMGVLPYSRLKQAEAIKRFCELALNELVTPVTPHDWTAVDHLSHVPREKAQELVNEGLKAIRSTLSSQKKSK